MSAGTPGQSVQGLLQWLARLGTDVPSPLADIRTDAYGGRELYASHNIRAGQRILEIPHAALLHSRALHSAHAAPSTTSLSSVQTVTRHLARWHAGLEPTSPWQPFLATLPVDFPTVPLAHLVDPLWDELLGHAPFGVRRRAASVRKRYERDWGAVGHVEPRIDEATYRWAWLAFNTRCVHFPLGHDDPNDNATLVPLLDMANHEPDRRGTPTLTLRQTVALDATPQVQSIAPDEIVFKQGEAITFTYGQHEDAMLLTDYGFVQHASNECNVIEVDELVEQLIAAFPPEEARARRELLAAHSYDGDYTVACRPPEPSYRLLTAVRLLSIPPKGSTQTWEAIVQGQLDEDQGPTIDALLSQLLVHLRDQALSSIASVRLLQGDSAFSYVRDCVVGLLKEQKEVAEALLPKFGLDGG